MQKFQIGTRVVVKRNLTLKGRVVDYSPAWAALGHRPAKYDVVIGNEMFTREFAEEALMLESRLTEVPKCSDRDNYKADVICILKKHLCQKPIGWKDVESAVREIIEL